jgi:hypothetical protein
MTTIIKYCAAVLFGFILLYKPKLVSSYNPVHFLSIISIIGLMPYWAEAQRFFAIKEVRRFLVCMFGVNVYAVFLVTLTSREYTYCYHYSLFLINVLPCSAFFAVLIGKWNLKFSDFLRILVFVGLIQSVVVLLMFTSDATRQLVLGILTKNGFDFSSGQLGFWSQYRIYGLATNYLYAFPVLQGLLAAVALYIALFEDARYMFALPTLVFSIIVNARTGLFIFGAASFLIFYHRLMQGRRLGGSLKISLVTIGFFFSFLGTLRLVESYSEFTSSWINAGIGETQDAMRGDFSGVTYATLLKESLDVGIPEGVGLLVGTGVQIGSGIVALTSNHAYVSDTGYVNDVVFGGIFFTAILYYSVLQLALFKSQHKADIALKWVLIAFMLAANIKGVAFIVHELSTAFVVICCVRHYLGSVPARRPVWSGKARIEGTRFGPLRSASTRADMWG